MGLLMNGFVKVPMQFLILLIGTLVFTFYQFNNAPIFFNRVQIAKIESSPLKDSFNIARNAFDKIAAQKQQAVVDFSQVLHTKDKEQQEIKANQLQSFQKTSDCPRTTP